MIKKIYKQLFSERQRNNVRYACYKFIGLFYRGNNYYCICCDHSFSKFLPYGNQTRKNALCPSCHSLERTRVLMYYLQDEVKLFNQTMKVLHFAPEKAIESKIKSTKKTDYITGDINPNLADHVIDITAIPYPEDSFDLVICSHVLGHIPDEAKAIDELYRVLKPNGEAIIMTVIDPELKQTLEDPNIVSEAERLKQYGESDLARKHGQDFEQRLKRKNITITRNDYRLTFNQEEQLRYSLGDGNREVIFSCRKN